MTRKRYQKLWYAFLSQDLNGYEKIGQVLKGVRKIRLQNVNPEHRKYSSYEDAWRDVYLKWAKNYKVGEKQK